MKLTGVYDNTVKKDGLVPGWGFSLLISGRENNILFDVGADLKILENNLKELNISPSSLDGVVLSHPHCDHIGGLSAILKNNSDLKVFFTKSFPSSLKKRIESYGAEPVVLSEPQEIFEGTWSTGEILDSYRNVSLPEQGLVISSSQGPVIISGCAHPGITKIAKRAKEITGSPPYLIVGGFHLVSRKTEEIRKVTGELREETVKKLAPAHCTGRRAVKIISKEYGEDCLRFGAGAEIVI